MMETGNNNHVKQRKNAVLKSDFFLPFSVDNRTNSLFFPELRAD